MKSVLGTAAICLLVAISLGARSASQNPQDFTLVNDTGLTIDELYLSPTDVNEWEEDVLGVDVLPDGESVDINFPYEDRDECAWDMRIVDEDGTEVVWTDVDLCTTHTITLRYENNRPTSDGR